MIDSVIDYIMSFDMYWWFDLLAKIFSSPFIIFGWCLFGYIIILTCMLKYNKKYRGNPWKDSGAELVFSGFILMLLIWVFVFLPIAVWISVFVLSMWGIISLITYLVNKS